MTNFLYYFLPFFMLLTFLFKLSLCQKYEFDECNNAPDGKHYCRKLGDCSTVMEAIMKGIPPKICSYRGSVAIVCCPPSKKSTSGPVWGTPIKLTKTPTKAPTKAPVTKAPTKAPVTKATTVKPVTKRTSATIVDEMCKKYSEEQYDVYTQPAQLLGDPDVKRKDLRCSTVSTLIVGGVPADPKEYPHMALIGYGANLNLVTWACGGTLISERYILSAAHCSSSGSLGAAKWARLGELDYSTEEDDAKPMDLEITERISHPNYKDPLVYNDIALFKLHRNVVFNAYMRPICLNTVNAITQNAGTATGWGVIGTAYSESTILLKVNISLVTGSYCRESFGEDSKKYPRGIEDESMVCAGEVAGGKDTCAGDSGGPLQVKVLNEPCLHSQIGVVSFGDGFCAKPGKPGVYTRVSHYIEWIQKIVWP